MTAAAVLAAGLRRRLGGRARVVDVRSKPLRCSSCHPISRLVVTLSDGRRLGVVFKRLQPAAGKDVRREVLAYERLLDRAGLDAPALYASRCDDDVGRYWLFLEDVEGQRLDWCAAPAWVPAFGWMARMHASWLRRERELARLQCLDDHGPPYWRALAGAAVASLRRHGRPDAAARLDRLVDRRLEGAAGWLAGQPRTLVHGDLSCRNIIVQADGRIRPLDWEWAAVGPGAWDLAKLLAGWGARKPRLLAAYADAYDRHAATPLDRAALAAAVTQCQALHALWYLRWWTAPCREPAWVDGLLDRLAERWARVGEPV